MPFQFQTVPASQIKKIKKETGRPKSPTPTLQKKATQKRTTVQLAAYGNRLFEPVMKREKPITVDFADYFVDNTRFSKDGFFAIKYFPQENRCYLVYFLNPVKVTKELDLISACQEAIEYKSWEYENEKEYTIAFQRRDYQELVKIRYQSALGKAELQIIEILKEKLVAEKFLARQKQIEIEEKDWQRYFEDKHKIEDEEELKGVQGDAELESNNGLAHEFQCERQKTGVEREEDKDSQIQEKATTGEDISKSQKSEIRTVAGTSITTFKWGGK
jgi:hypothetical protein